MNILNSPYIHYTFQTSLKSKIDLKNNRSLKGTYVYISKIIHKWMAVKFPDLKLPTNPSNYQKNSYTQTVDSIYDYDNCFYCIKTTHTDKTVANRVWITEVEIHQENDELVMGVKNAYTSNNPKSDDDYQIYSVPTFVSKILNKVQFVEANEPVDRLILLNSENELQSAYKLILNPSRQHPVIIISQNKSLNEIDAKYCTIEDGYLIDGHKLLENIKYISHIYYLPYTMQELWAKIIGQNWSVFNGAVRTYYPYFDINDNCYYNHPIMNYKKMLTMNYVNNDGTEYWGGQAFRHILSHSIKSSNIYARINWDNLGYQFFYKANRNNLFKNQKARKDASEWCSLLESDNTELNKQIDELTALLNAQDEEINNLKSTIRKQGAANVISQQRIYQLNKALSSYQNNTELEYPTNYIDIPDWIEQNFGGRIELLPKAIRSLKSAVYKDINLVCKLIEGLGTTYYNMRMNYIEKKEYDEFLIQLGVEDTPAISDASAGEQGEEYYPLYNGKKHKLERHLTKGASRDPRDCLRIYFFWDDELNLVVIGSLPEHLKIRSSN